MEQRLVVYEQNIADNGRDYGEIQRILILDKDFFTIEKINFILTEPMYEFDNDRIKSMEIFRSSELTTNNTGVGGALAGAVLFGVAGAVIGGLATRGKKDAWLLELVDNQDKVYLYRLKNELDAMRLKKWKSKNL